MKLKVVAGTDYQDSEAPEPEAPAAPSMFDTATARIGDAISEQLAFLLEGVAPELHSHVATALSDWLRVSAEALATIAAAHDLEISQDRVVH